MDADDVDGSRERRVPPDVACDRPAVIGSDDERATLEVGGATHDVSYDEVAKAKVQIEFSRKGT